MPTIQIPVVAACYVSSQSGNRDTNYSTSFALFDNNFYTSFLKFNIGEMPADKFIVSATLRLRGNANDPGVATPILTEVTSDWVYTTVTYNTRPSTGALTVTGDNWVINGENTFDVTEIFSKQVEDGNDYGIQIRHNRNPSASYSTALSSTPSFRPYVDVVYSDFAPVVPSPTYPVNVAVDRQEDVTLRWNGPNHLNVNLVWNDGSDNDVNIAGNAFEYTIPASTINAGQVVWRVRQEYTDVGFSEFSADVEFTAANKPVTPVINETTVTVNLPTFTWSSTNQNAFNFVVEENGVPIVDYTEFVSTQSYTLTRVLEDNTEYDFKVRYRDTNGLWSDFDTNTITTNFSKPDTPLFSIVNNGDHIQVTIVNGADTEFNQILKEIDGVYEEILYAEEDGTVLVYELISDKSESINVRAYSSAGGFVDGTPQSATVTVEDTHIITSDLEDEIDLKFTPRYTISHQKETKGYAFQGREKEVAVVGDKDTSKPNMSFELFSQAEVEKLLGFRGKKILVRNKRGFLVWGVIPGFSEQYRNVSTIVSARSFIEVER